MWSRRAEQEGHGRHLGLSAQMLFIGAMFTHGQRANLLVCSMNCLFRCRAVVEP
jgi:hypothetical protein